MTPVTDPTLWPDHLSVSSVQLYRRCPLAWKRRYVDGVEETASPAMAFGKAFALALEAHHNGEDGDTAFARAHARTGNALPGALFGLRLLELYRQRFNFRGRPEHPFSLYLPDRTRVPVPITGIVDLECDTEILEFKTARNPWSQARADAEYQSAVYGWAFEQLHGRPPEQVRYLVFSTRSVDVQDLLTHPTMSDLRLFELAAISTWNGITTGRFAGCGRCSVCQPAGDHDTASYDWWSPSRPRPGAGLPLAPSAHHAWWTRPAGARTR